MGRSFAFYVLHADVRDSRFPQLPDPIPDDKTQNSPEGKDVGSRRIFFWSLFLVPLWRVFVAIFDRAIIPHISGRDLSDTIVDAKNGQIPNLCLGFDADSESQDLFPRFYGKMISCLG